MIHFALRCEHYFLRSNIGLIKIGGLEFYELQKSRDMNSFSPPAAAFMAPELMDGQVTVKADVYSFGLSLLQMITQSTPYSEYSTTAEIWEHKLMVLFLT